MTTPNIPNSVQFHAAARVTGGTGATVSAQNITSVTRNGAGDYTVVLGTEIDPLTRSIQVSIEGAAAGFASVDNQTDAGFDILTFNQAGAATDFDHSFTVQRTAVVD